MQTASILVVCTGNVCRSPYIEHRLRQMIGDDSTLRIRSAGTAALVGAPMASHTARLLSRHGASGAHPFQARQVTADLIQGADLVLAAAAEHRSTIVRLAPVAAARTYTLGQLRRLLLVSENSDGWRGIHELTTWAAHHRHLTGPRTERDDIPDPWRRSRFAYALMARKADPMIQTVAEALRGVDPRPR